MLQVTRTGIAIIDVVGVFPYVNGHQRRRVGGQRSTCVGGGNDSQFAIRSFNQPGPARTEVFDSGVGKLRFEIRKAAKGGGNCLGQFTGWFATCVRCQAVPVERVVPDLCCVIEDTTFRATYDLFQ